MNGISEKQRYLVNKARKREGEVSLECRNSNSKTTEQNWSLPWKWRYSACPNQTRPTTPWKNPLLQLQTILASRRSAASCLPASKAYIKAVVTCCRLAGRLQRYENVVSVTDQCLEQMEDDAPVIVHGYKGLALYQLRKYKQAVIVLEKSQYLLRQMGTKSELAQSVERRVEEALIAVCNALGREAPLPELIKFPRTFHLFNIQGSTAITSDDKILAKDHMLLKRMCDGTTEVILEEKVDGANLGVTYFNGKFLVQNRSHYISSGDHAQYDQVHAWLEEHREPLYDLLHSLQYILYGEWLAARHSVPYLQLPGYFMAFDIWDTKSSQFLSRQRFHTMLLGSTIPVVPLLSRQTFGPYRDTQALQDRLLELVQTTPSQFRTDGGPIEGVVIRLDNEDWNVERSKLVRPDFVAGCSDGHWTRRAIEKQRTDIEFTKDYLENCYCFASVPESLPHKIDDRFRAVACRAVLEDGVYQGTTLRMVPATTQRLEKDEILLPSEMCWLWENEVLLSTAPSSAGQVDALRSMLNVGRIVSSTDLPREWFDGSPIQCSYYSIGTTPKLSQMDSIGDDVVRTVASEKVVLICGDVQVLAAGLLQRIGKDGVQFRLENENRGSESRTLLPRPPQMTVDLVAEEIQHRLGGFVGKEHQVAFVGLYDDHLQRTYDLFQRVVQPAPLPALNEQPFETTPESRPSFIVLSGIPASGKSTIAQHLAASPVGNQQWIHASTDELGRDGCERLVGRESARVSRGLTGGVIVDCCNVQRHERLQWVKTMHQPDPKHVALVFVDTSEEVAISRVQYRIGHPTIPFGRGKRIVKGFATRLEAPGTRESSIFGRIEVVRSPDDMARLLSRWGAPLP